MSETRQPLGGGIGWSPDYKASKEGTKSNAKPHVCSTPPEVRAEVASLREALADLAYQASATGDRNPGLLEAIDAARALLASKPEGGGK